MIPVIALVVGAELRAQVARAAGREAEVIFCERAPQLRDMVARHGALAIVSELVDAVGADTRPTIGQLSQRAPGIHIIVVHDRPLPEADELLDLGRLGVSGWIHKGARDLVPAMRTALARGELRSPAAAIMDRALPLVPPDLHPFLIHCAHAAVGPVKVEQAARAAGFAPRTLRARLRRAGLPPAWEIVRWNRMLHALWRLDVSGRPVKTVAASLGFESAMALRKYSVRLTGLTIGQLLSRGGFGYLLGRFEREMAGG